MRKTVVLGGEGQGWRMAQERAVGSEAGGEATEAVAGVFSPAWMGEHLKGKAEDAEGTACSVAWSTSREFQIVASLEGLG